MQFPSENDSLVVQRIPGDLFRSMAALFLADFPGVSSSNLARTLCARLAARGVRYHERTIRRQMDGSVATVSQAVESELRALLMERKGLDSTADVELLLINAGLSVPKESRVPNRIPISEVDLIVGLWLHFNPNRTRRGLAHTLCEKLAQKEAVVSKSYLEAIIGGRVHSVSRDVIDVLLTCMGDHGVHSMEDARAIAKKNEEQLSLSEAGRSRVSASEFASLTRIWQWRRRGGTKRQLATALQKKLAERGVSYDLAHIQQILSGSVQVSQRRVLEALELIVTEVLPEGLRLEQAASKVETGRVAETDVEWVKAQPIVERADQWLSEHPGVSKRQLSCSIERAARKMGYRTSHNTVQNLLAGKTSRTRGFVYRAILKVIDPDRSARVPAEHVLQRRVRLARKETEWKRTDRRASSASDPTDGAGINDVDALMAFRRKMGSASKLSHEEERAIFTRILEAERSVLASLLRTDFGRSAAQELISRLLAGEFVSEQSEPTATREGEETTADEEVLQRLDSFSRFSRCYKRLGASFQDSQNGDHHAQVTWNQADFEKCLMATHDESSYLFDQLGPMAHRFRHLVSMGQTSDPGYSIVYRDSQLSALQLREVAEEIARSAQDALHARAELVERHLRFAMHIAKKYTNFGLPLIDLIQEGTIGLMKAADKFEVQRGYRFSTYARWWIRQVILRAIAEQGKTIRISVSSLERIAKVRRVRWKLSQTLNREPTLQEIASELLLPVEGIHELALAAKTTLSLQSPIGEEDDGYTLGDTIEDQSLPHPLESADSNKMAQTLREVISTLKPKEQKVLRMRFGIDGAEHSLQDIGQEFGVSRERIRQIESKALGKLRGRNQIRPLRELLHD